MFYPRSVDIIKTVLHLWMKGSPSNINVATGIATGRQTKKRKTGLKRDLESPP